MAKLSARRDIRTSLYEGCAYSIMVGTGETFIPAFVLAIGMSEVSAGLISTLPLLAGALLQMMVPTMVAHFRSYRKWIVLCGTIQSLVFLPLMAAAVWGWAPPLALFFLAAIYWGAGMAMTPAWYCWVSSLVPEPVRTAFFAKRTRFTQLFALLGFLLGGVILHFVTHGERSGTAFALLFGIAFLARNRSVNWLASHTEIAPPKACAEKSRWALYGFDGETSPGGRRLLVYMLVVQFATYTSSPFFNSYMLGSLKMCYFDYSILIAASFLAKVVCLPWLGKVAQRRGAQDVLWIGGVGLVLNPLFWLFGTSVPYLFVVQVISGFVWAAYELAVLLLVIQKTTESERVTLMTTYNLGYALAITLSSIAGGALLQALGTNPHAYAVLFVVSAVARSTTLLVLMRVSSRRIPSIVLEVDRIRKAG